jgi:hypothetical protein
MDPAAGFYLEKAKRQEGASGERQEVSMRKDVASKKER